MRIRASCVRFVLHYWFWTRLNIGYTHVSVQGGSSEHVVVCKYLCMYICFIYVFVLYFLISAFTEPLVPHPCLHGTHSAFHFHFSLLCKLTLFTAIGLSEMDYMNSEKH